jgi:RNA polymerase sigma-70 factor (ECF subfamily)
MDQSTMSSAPTLVAASPLPGAGALAGSGEGTLPVATAAMDARERLEAMFVAHHRLIWRTLRRLGLPPDAATDTTQQVYLVAAERLTDIRSGCERAFLFSTGLKLARSWRRKQMRCELDANMDERSSAARPEDEAVSQHTAAELMDRLLSRMDPDLVAVFILFELEGMSTPEIAELVGIPLGTAASRLRRARLAFREGAARLERSGGRSNP